MGETTHSAVVLAANCVSRAGAGAAHANDSDGGTGEPDEDIDALDDDTEYPEEVSGIRGAGLWTVARRDWTV